jgi:RNA polymerase sigma-70 factor (ECF subfamily)
MREAPTQLADSMRKLSRSIMHLQTMTEHGQDENEAQSSDQRPDGQRSSPVFNGGDFALVYATRYNDVKRWIRALGASTEDLDDLAQEVFIVVHRRLHDFDGKNVAAWLHRIAKHQVRDFNRLSWIRNVFKRSVPLSSRLVSKGPTPLMAFETREKQRVLERLLAELSEPMRDTFVLFEIEGYTSDEIATLHQVSANTARARILRTRTKVLVRLKDGLDSLS